MLPPAPRPTLTAVLTGAVLCLVLGACAASAPTQQPRRVPIDHTGVYTTWWSDGVVRETGEYAQGERHGFVQGFNPDGTLSFEGHFEHGLPMGEMVTRYPGGGVKVAETMTAGRRQGVRIEYFESTGTPRIEEAWDDNVRHGHVLTWYEDGVLASEGRYERGLPAGTWRSWDAQGRLTATRYFWVSGGSAEGRLETTWRPDGSVSTQTLMTRADGVWSGWSTTWYPDGRQASLTEFEDDLRHGRELGWSTSGRKLTEGHWDRDRRDGTWTTWDESGAVQRRTEYAQGQVLSES